MRRICKKKVFVIAKKAKYVRYERKKVGMDECETEKDTPIVSNEIRIV